MNNIDTILSLLAEGHSIDSIAADFTKALNEAKKIQEETEKEKKIARLEDAEDLIQTANYFFNEYFPGTIRFDFTAEELVNAMEELAPELKKLSKLIETFSETPKVEANKTKEEPATGITSSFNSNSALSYNPTPADPFTYFFKNFNL